MAANKKMKSPYDVIEKTLAWTGIPTKQGKNWKSKWLQELGRRMQCSAPEDLIGDETAIAKAILESLGGDWGEDCTEAGELSDYAVGQISELISLQLVLQESVGLGTLPIRERKEFFLSILDEIMGDAYQVDEDNFSIPLLCKVMDCAEEELDSALRNNRGEISKLGQEELLTFLEKRKEEDGNPEPSLDEEVEESRPTEISEWGNQPVEGVTKHPRIDGVMTDINNGLLSLDPAWQRGDVWSLKKKRKLIESVLLGIPLPSVIYHRNSENETVTVIDGKQRLTALSEFFSGKWALGKYPAESPLHDVSGKKYEKLPTKFKGKFYQTELIVVEFKDLPPPVLYKVFELYNISGMKLNAVEIRNAVFHDHPLQKMLFDLGGDRLDPEQYVEGQKTFTDSLRQVIAKNGHPPRFSTTDFLSRYLAYCRAPVSTKSEEFVAASTSKIIQIFFEESVSYDENPQAVAQEIVDVFNLAGDLYFANELDPFAIASGATKEYAFTKLRATNSMMCAYVILKLRKLCDWKPVDEENAIKAVDDKVGYPEKQQTKSIWHYHARSITTLINELGVTDDLLQKSDVRHLASIMRDLDEKFTEEEVIVEEEVVG